MEATMMQQPDPEIGSDTLSNILPILPLYEVTLFPKMVMQAESIKLIDEAMNKDRVIGLLVSKQSPQEGVQPEKDLYSIGTSALTSGSVLANRSIIIGRLILIKFVFSSACTEAVRG